VETNWIEIKLTFNFFEFKISRLISAARALSMADLVTDLEEK